MLYVKAFFLVLYCSIAKSQNSTEQIISSESIKDVVIDGNQIFKIDIITHDLQEICLQSQIDGEYLEFFQITKTIKNGAINIQLEENPVISVPDDKRNAHKVVAAKLMLTIPNGLSVHIVSDVGSVSLIGTFNLLSIQLLEGFCEIEGTALASTINTIDGNISIRTSKGKVIANTRYGKLALASFNKKDEVWRLKSIHGDITVTKKN